MRSCKKNTVKIFSPQGPLTPKQQSFLNKPQLFDNGSKVAPLEDQAAK